MYYLISRIAMRLAPKHIFLCFSVFSFAAVFGCQGIFYNFSKPLENLIYIADVAFDNAEAEPITIDRSRNTDAAYTKKQQLYQSAITLYEEAILKDVQKIHTQRAHHEIATIYRRLYQFDQSIEHYHTILKLGDKGYYASLAKKQIDNIRKNQEIIKEKLAKYQDSISIYNQTPSEETFNLAAESLYLVAQTYEELEDFHAAIRTYQKFVEEFPKHNKVPQAQFQIGNIYFYNLYDYTNDGGWGAFVAVAENFPNSPEAKKTIALLNESNKLLSVILDLQRGIENYKKRISPNTTTHRSVGITPRLTKTELKIRIVQFYYQIAENWIKMRNYPRAIQTYRNIVSETPQMKHNTGIGQKKIAAVQPFDRIGNLYQRNGQFERAIYAYDQLFKNAPSRSFWISHSYYEKAICYDAIYKYTDAYKCFKAYLRSPLNDGAKLDKARQMVGQYELDQDSDGYSFYQEQENGTSDLEVNILSQEN